MFGTLVLASFILLRHFDVLPRRPKLVRSVPVWRIYVAYLFTVCSDARRASSSRGCVLIVTVHMIDFEFMRYLARIDPCTVFRDRLWPFLRDLLSLRLPSYKTLFFHFVFRTQAFLIRFRDDEAIYDRTSAALHLHYIYAMPGGHCDPSSS